MSNCQIVSSQTPDPRRLIVERDCHLCIIQTIIQRHSYSYSYHTSMGPLTTFSFQTTETNRSSHQRAAHLEEVSCQGPLQRSASPLVGNLSSLALPKGAYAVYTPQFALATLPVPVWSQAGPSGGFPQQDSHSHGDGDAPFRYYEENSIVSNDEQTIQSGT